MSDNELVARQLLSASGDLFNWIFVIGRDDTSMLYALPRIQIGLSTTVSGIAASAEAGASASSKISQGNVDLLQGTEQQAVALEKTASRIEE